MITKIDDTNIEVIKRHLDMVDTIRRRLNNLLPNLFFQKQEIRDKNTYTYKLFLKDYKNFISEEQETIYFGIFQGKPCFPSTITKYVYTDDYHLLRDVYDSLKISGEVFLNRKDMTLYKTALETYL